jgi:hypothetical protein
MKSVSRRISDGRMLRLIKMWLETPVEEIDAKGNRHRTTRNTDQGMGTPQGAPITPPTILRSAPLGGSFKREWANFVFDSDRVVTNLHSSDQRSHDLSPSAPVCVLEPFSYARCEHLQLVDCRLHVLRLRLPIRYGFGFEFQFRQPLFRCADARLELISLEKPFLVGIDQPCNPTPNGSDQTRELLRRSSRFFANAA